MAQLDTDGTFVTDSFHRLDKKALHSLPVSCQNRNAAPMMKFRSLCRIRCRASVGRTATQLLAGFTSLASLADLARPAGEATLPRAVERILAAHDTCPDVTWGWTEEQTRQAFADLVRSHLDEMQRTDAGPQESRDHFNMATTQEALDFMARYPARRAELIRRIREGRVCVSPFLCNSLWGFQSVEGALRTLYPARRLEREWTLRLEVAEHIELPSMPWGMASLLAGCGVRWVSNPFLDYDCTFEALRNPPLFRWAGPDGSEVRVILDAWASERASYAQGALLLREPARIANEWLPYYRQLGAAYPLSTILASGTHSDISPESWKQTRGFSEALRQFNAPDSGEELWRAEFLGGEVVPSPIHAAGLVLAGAMDGKFVALRADGRGDVTKSHAVWAVEDDVPAICSPVATEERVFLVKSDGRALCYRIQDGLKLWEQDLGAHFQASPSIADGRLYLLSESGTMLILGTGDDFTLTEFALACDWLYGYEGFTPELKAVVRSMVLPLAERGLRFADDHMFHNYIGSA